MGVSHSFSARVGLRNKFRLCDNMWHTVKANYVKDSLTLRVDNYREAYGFNGSDDDQGTITDAPLYIGGLPGKVSYASKVKGRMRCTIHNLPRMLFLYLDTEHTA